MGKSFPLLLLGALGVGVAYWLYQNSDQISGSSGGAGSSSGEWYDVIGGGAATATPLGNAGAGAGRASVEGSGSAGAYTGYNYGVSSGYIADVKKSAAVDLSGNYQALTANDIAALNQQLTNFYAAEGRDSQSALNFVAVPSNAVAAANIKNPGISNAGSSLTSIVNSDGSYNVYDWRGNIVSSGSAGAFQAAYSSGSSSGSSGGAGSSSGSSKKAAALSSGSSSGITGSKDTVNIIADKASVIRSSSGSSSGSSKKAAAVSSGSSSGYAQGGAVRSNTTAGKYTG